MLKVCVGGAFAGGDVASTFVDLSVSLDTPVTSTTNPTREQPKVKNARGKRSKALLAGRYLLQNIMKELCPMWDETTTDHCTRLGWADKDMGLLGSYVGKLAAKKMAQVKVSYLQLVLTM